MVSGIFDLGSWARAIAVNSDVTVDCFTQGYSAMFAFRN